jgi:hypothetical protein
MAFEPILDGLNEETVDLRVLIHGIALERLHCGGIEIDHDGIRNVLERPAARTGSRLRRVVWHLSGDHLCYNFRRCRRWWCILDRTKNHVLV